LWLYHPPNPTAGACGVRWSDVDDMTDEQLARAQTALASLEKRVVDLRRLLS